VDGFTCTLKELIDTAELKKEKTRLRTGFLVLTGD